MKWCKQGGEFCPICKVRIETLKRDYDFDKLNDSLDIELEKLLPTIIINFPKDSDAGITLANNYSILNFGKRLPGVRVTKINKNKQCYKEGLRQGNIILFINKVPCINHEQVITIINNAILSNTKVNLIIG